MSSSEQISNPIDRPQVTSELVAAMGMRVSPAIAIADARKQQV